MTRLEQLRHCLQCHRVHTRQGWGVAWSSRDTVIARPARITRGLVVKHLLLLLLLRVMVMMMMTVVVVVRTHARTAEDPSSKAECCQTQKQ